jgi:DNA-directed RNA polymerase specialized sigma24 family protein
MDLSSGTRPRLLVRIHDPHDREAWEQFVQLYAELVYGFLCKRGLADGDAARVMADVLYAVVSAPIPPPGAFRGWLLSLTNQKLASFLKTHVRGANGLAHSATQRTIAVDPVSNEDAHAWWESEYEQRMLAWAAEQVRDGFSDQTWQAFWLTAALGQPAGEVGQRLGLSRGAVVLAKSRVLARLRQQVDQIEDR